MLKVGKMAAFNIFSLFFLSYSMMSMVSAASFKNCNETEPIQFYFTMPDPLIVTPGKPFSMFAGADLRTTISAPMKVKHIMERQMFGKWVKLPCVGHVGSCTFDMPCEELADMSSQGKCPIEPGRYPRQPVSVPVPDIPMPSFMVDGFYKVHIEGYTFNMKELLFCGEITQEMKRGDGQYLH